MLAYCNATPLICPHVHAIMGLQSFALLFNSTIFEQELIQNILILMWQKLIQQGILPFISFGCFNML